jgi:hypothetical protein
MPTPSCHVCASALTGRQRRYCSRHCKNADTNNRHQSYVAQVARGLARKKELLGQFGGKCTRCGYSRNSAALVWHHIDGSHKAFELDIRSLSNRSAAAVAAEAAKCILLCANCHAEVHWPQFTNATDRA